jgi:hypothetical protein
MVGRGCVTARVLAGLAVAAAAALLVSGCSSPAAPGLFPAVFNDPPPRDEATLSPDQVKQAMDNLISDRNHLCSQATANSSSAAPPSCGMENAVLTGATQTPDAGVKP